MTARATQGPSETTASTTREREGPGRSSPRRGSADCRRRAPPTPAAGVPGSETGSEVRATATEGPRALTSRRGTTQRGGRRCRRRRRPSARTAAAGPRSPPTTSQGATDIPSRVASRGTETRRPFLRVLEPLRRPPPQGFLSFRRTILEPFLGKIGSDGATSSGRDPEGHPAQYDTGPRFPWTF